MRSNEIQCINNNPELRQLGKNIKGTDKLIEKLSYL